MTFILHVSFLLSADARLASLPHSIPQLFGSSCSPCSWENTYLCHKSKSLSHKSLITAAEHVNEFTRWRISSGLEIEDIGEDVFEMYVDALCSFRNSEGDFLSWNTVNSRVAGAYRFLIWSHVQGHCPLLDPQESKNSRAGAKKFKSKGHPSRKLSEPVKFLILDVAKKFVAALSGVSDKKECGLAERNKLIASLMLQCGLRVSEAISFPISDLPKINRDGHSTPARVRGKGNKPRTILIPNRLLADIWGYVDVARAKVLEGIKKETVVPVFISARGKAVTRNWIEKLFVRAGESIGVKAVPHALRHTFASYHYLINGDIVALAQVLGHSDTATTEKFYVHIARLISYTVSYERLQLDFDAIAKGAYDES